MDLSNSVIMPRDDFDELTNAAYSNQHVPFKDRAASTAQTTFVFAALAGAVTAGAWGCTKAVDWLEERRLKRDLARRETKQP